MSKVVGRGVKTSQDTIDSLKKELEIARKAGEELVKKNKKLEDKIKADKAEIDTKDAKIKELEDKINNTKETKDENKK